MIIANRHNNSYSYSKQNNELIKNNISNDTKKIQKNINPHPTTLNLFEKRAKSAIRDYNKITNSKIHKRTKSVYGSTMNKKIAINQSTKNDKDKVDNNDYDERINSKSHMTNSTNNFFSGSSN